MLRALFIHSSQFQCPHDERTSTTVQKKPKLKWTGSKACCSNSPLRTSVIGDDPDRHPDSKDTEHGQIPGTESNTQTGAIITRPTELARGNIGLPALGTRETPAVVRKLGIRQRRLHFTPHFCHGRKYENLLPNRHGCRRLRVPTEQNPGKTEKGRLRTVRRQWNDHYDLWHDTAVFKPSPTTRFQMVFHSGRRIQANHRDGLPKPLWVVGGSTKPTLNRSYHQTLNRRIRSRFRSRFRIHQDNHRRDEPSSASSRISGPYASVRLRT
jgi:hypothetical protein